MSRRLKEALPFADEVVAVMTAGELGGGKKLYHDTPGHWDNIVIHGFSKKLFSQVSVATVDLFNGNASLTAPQRVQNIENELNKIRVPFDVNSQDTLALTYFDGLTASEDFFSQALYRSERFPCYFVGGSAGGKLDFGQADISLNGQVQKNKAILSFCKVAPAYRYGLFKRFIAAFRGRPPLPS